MNRSEIKGYIERKLDSNGWTNYKVIDDESVNSPDILNNGMHMVHLLFNITDTFEIIQQSIYFETHNNEVSGLVGNINDYKIHNHLDPIVEEIITDILIKVREEKINNLLN